MQEVIYQEAFNLLKPETCIFIISRDKNEKPNIMPGGWSMKCSHEPPLFAVAISKEGYTHQLIRETKEFVIAVAHKGMEKYLEEFGSVHGHLRNKFEGSDIQTEKAKYVHCPLLKDATINLECSLYKEVEAGDHLIFIGKVLTSYVNPGKKIMVSMKGAHGKRIYEEY